MAQIRDIDIDVNLNGSAVRLAALNAAIALATASQRLVHLDADEVIAIASDLELYLINGAVDA